MAHQNETEAATGKIRGSPRSIYVACPANTRSGGPELLHQLVSELCRQGHNAAIYYYGRNKEQSPVHPEMSNYRAPYVDKIEDLPGNAFIVPEVNTALLDTLKHATKYIWWMSVDNYYKYLSPHIGWRRSAVSLLQQLHLKPRPYVIGSKWPAELTHLVQSQYAHDHLVDAGVAEMDIRRLGDYLNLSFLNEDYGNLMQGRSDIITYNPKKGIDFTRRLIDAAPDLRLVPIENLDRNGVVRLLRAAKIYIDFGHHPGKDRMPREAAILGACVVTGRRGAAGNTLDIPIPDEYKYSENIDLQTIASNLREILVSYPSHATQFDSYRDQIRREPRIFQDDLSVVFGTAN